MTLGAARRRPPSDIRWGAITLSGAAGIGLCVVGGLAFSDPYLQAVAVNLGTSLLLFGYLWVAERRLTRSIDSLHVPRSLADAQDRLRELLRDEAEGAGHPGAEDVVTHALRSATAKIMKAGFAQVRPEPGTRDVELVSSHGRSIRWTLVCDSSSLRHVIRLPDGNWQGESVAISSLTDPLELQLSLQRFEDEVYDGLCHVLASLRGA